MYDNETVSQRAINIVSNEPITVYAIDYADKSCEAFVVLPNEALGNEYYVMSFQSDGKKENAFGETFLTNQSTPSQFAVVATEDSTNVTITPRAATHKNRRDIQKIVLNKGEVYLVQAYISTSQLNNDLTGSHISADKPVAVFAGHQRATTPKGIVDLSNNGGYQYNPSRDCLIEQMIPTNFWGKNTIVTPFAAGSNDKNEFNNFYRIMACRDSTYILINNELVDTLNAGEFYEADLVAAFVASNRPILVAQYARTEGYRSSNSSNYIGDPLLIMTPPIEQYKQSYTVVNSQVRSYFVQQYLNIVAPDTATSDVYIDGVQVLASNFIKLKDIEFSYAKVRTTSGTHNITSGSPISVQVYGYGNAVSYGYLGGMNTADVLKNKAQITVNGNCEESGNFIYRETYNATIKDYKIIELVNLERTLKSLKDRYLEISFDRIDMTQSGYYTIEITDIWDEKYVYSDTLNPKTFSVIKNDATVSFGDCKIGSRNVIELEIVNNDLYAPFTIDETGIQFANNTLFTVAKSDIPLVLPPRDTAVLRLYYSPTAVNKDRQRNVLPDIDTLYLHNECVSYTIILSGTPTSDTIEFEGTCGAPIKCIADSLTFGGQIPQIVPNPVSDDNNPIYKFTLAVSGDVRICLYDANGNELEVLSDGALDMGNYELPLNTAHLPSGTYFVKLATSNATNITKFLIQK
jgi:hypothetical protein